MWIEHYDMKLDLVSNYSYLFIQLGLVFGRGNSTAQALLWHGMCRLGLNLNLAALTQVITNLMKINHY